MTDTVDSLLGPAPATSGKETVTSLLGPAPEGGRRVARGKSITAHTDQDYPAIPYLQRTLVSHARNPQEAESILEKFYGKGSVGTDKKGLYVTANGKRMRAGTADFTASLPEVAGGIAGAALGSAGGPAGSMVGAGAGMTVVRGIEEAAKGVAGVRHQTAGETAKDLAGTFVGGAVGEGITRVAKAPISRLTRGPIPEIFTDTKKDIPGKLTGAERESLIRDATSKGAKLHPQSTMPGARALQRHVIMADRILGRSVGAEQDNLKYLTDEVSKVLDKAGVKGLDKAEAMSHLGGSTAALDPQQTGQMIQFKAKFMLDKLQARAKFAGVKAPAKDVQYLMQLASPGAKPLDVYNALTRQGETDMLERFFKLAGDKPGKESTVVLAVRQQALKEILAGALKRSETGEAVGAIDAELSKFTAKQQKALFPNGLDSDLRLLAKKAELVFPHIEDPGMAGMAAGEVLGRSAIKFPKVWKSRLVRQGYEGLWRTILTNPSMASRLALGFKGDSAQRIAARNALRAIIYSGFVKDGGQDEGTNTGQ